ncbi:TolC family protein [Candidatus Latescibacterota bacterium]
MITHKYYIRLFSMLICFSLLFGGQLHARIIDFTLQNAIDTALENSYQIKRLKLGIEQSRYSLKAREAGLKSQVSLNINSPDLSLLSDYQWNSTLQKDIIFRRNTLRWQSNLSVRQPLIIFGYPTNGYLSLNNTLYQYNQKMTGDDDFDTNYYSRFFFKFDQPLLQPNYLKNSYEEAELNLERVELNYINNLTRLLNSTSYDYFNLFSLSYQNEIGANYVNNLERVAEIVKRNSEGNSDQSLEEIQVQLELSNVREKLLENQSDLRLEISQVKQGLRIDSEDSLSIKTDIDIKEVNVDHDQAIQYGLNLRPTLRLLDISRRSNEIYLEEVKSSGAFKIDLSITYGLEKRDEHYQELWEENDNSYSVSVRAYIPIWDWGKRKANISATKTYIKQNDLSMEENISSIKSEITNGVKNLEEYKQRAFNMKENMETVKQLSVASLLQFAQGMISTQDMLKILERQNDTELNFLDSYLGYKRALINLMVDTHYDYENQITLIDKFNLEI